MQNQNRAYLYYVRTKQFKRRVQVGRGEQTVVTVAVGVQRD
jgi:hypothetical protein